MIGKSHLGFSHFKHKISTIKMVYPSQVITFQCEGKTEEQILNQYIGFQL